MACATLVRVVKLLLRRRRRWLAIVRDIPHKQALT
jgi:hypothetical protein